jgi:prevent-host-death family protein
VAWQVQEAKQQLSRVLDLAQTEGPQIVTRHGREVAVVLSIEDYRALGGGTVADALRGLADDGGELLEAAIERVTGDRARSHPRGDEIFG